MRRTLIWIAVGAVLTGTSVFVFLYGLAPGLRETAHRRTELYLKTHFRSSVQISDFRVLSLYPNVRVTLGGVVLRQESRNDGPPLIEVRRVTFAARPLSLLGRTPVVTFVQIEGMEVRVPPRRRGAPPLIPNLDKDLPSKYPVTIDRIHADDVVLQILPRDTSRAPREFAIHHLELGRVGLAHATRFEAILTNPVPKGEIRSSGTFGPWNADDPAETPVSGNYLFQNADFATIKGLGGTLSSTGRFSGPLDYLSVEGETTTPNFTLRTSNHPVDLHTNFSAIVDGTNGNVILNDVLAHFLNTTLDVKGQVVDRTPQRGRTILLDAVSRGARVQDLLRLAVNSDPPTMTGPAQLRTHIQIGEGDTDLVDRLKLDGQFDLTEAQFTSPQTSQKIETLSLKGQGKPGAPLTGDPITELNGTFRVESGVVTFSQLRFGVAGASIALKGTYSVDSGELDFRGRMRLQAKISQTTTGAKSFFLKAVDPFFEGKGAGTILPIKITGTKNQPLFGLDFHDKLNRD